jgi:hypothetical protein
MLGNVVPGIETGFSFPAVCPTLVSRGSGLRTLLAYTLASSNNHNSRVWKYLNIRKSSLFLVEGSEDSLSGTGSSILYQERILTYSEKNCGSMSYVPPKTARGLGYIFSIMINCEDGLASAKDGNFSRFRGFTGDIIENCDAGPLSPGRLTINILGGFSQSCTLMMKFRKVTRPG